MAWTLKVEFQGERRRLKDWVPVGEEPTVPLVRSGVARLFDMSPDQELKLLYKDNEGEVCTLTDTTFPDVLCLAVESRICRVICELVEEEPGDFKSALHRIRANIQDGSVRLRTSIAQLGANVSNGAQQLSTSASSSLQAGAQQLGENVQDSRASLHASASQFREEFGNNFQTTRASVHATIGQVSSEILNNLQEGQEGFKKRSQELGGDLREGGAQLKQSITESVDGLMTRDGTVECSKTRAASAVVAGGAALAVTRSLPLAFALGAFAAGAVRGTDAQESAGSEVSVPDIARPPSEVSASDAAELIDSDIISLPDTTAGEHDIQDAQTAVADAVQTEHDEDDDMVLVDAESGSTS